jgi:nicotinamidase-related amidase
MRSAFIVIDVQRGMFMPPTPAYCSEEVAARIAALLARARAGGTPIFHVQHDGGPGDVLERGSEGWHLHPTVAPSVGEPIVEKRYCSAFQDTPLAERLSEAGIERLILAGLQTEFCIDTTCRAAAALGYKVVLVSDAHTTFDSPVLPAAQIIAHHNRVLQGGAFCELAPAMAVKF